MTSDQIASIIEGLIPISLGSCGLIVSKNKTILNPDLTKYLKPLSILGIGAGILIVAKPFLNTPENNINYRDVASKINDSISGTYIDQVTRIDSVTIGTHNEFIYNYSVLNIKSTEVDNNSKEIFENNIRGNMRNNPKLDKFLKYGNPVILKYFGADSILITEIKIEANN